ncbi:MAG: chorismate mutase [Thermoplasmata archaeon]|nr:MAG: chorismate mutase [Thermoplasmata archaeon]
MIKSMRAEIGAIDAKILQQVAKRLELARNIGEEKSKLGIPVIDGNVEREVLERNKKFCAELGLDPKLGEELTDILIKYSIKVQNARGD